MAFGFTGKELDAETGLYYFGARYYDARTSVWVSPDPILEKYLPTGDKEKDKQLPGMGGVFNSFNLGLYSYVHLNPTRYTDPDGRCPVCVVVWVAIEVGLSVYDAYDTGKTIFFDDNATTAEKWVAGAGFVGGLFAPGGGYGTGSKQVAKNLNKVDKIKDASKQTVKSVARELKTKLNLDKQGKHIPGHKNYIPGRSPFTHENPQELLNKFSGTGQQVGNVPKGQPGYRERVDFGTIIGNVNGQPTTKGIIHHAKDGTAHIVPANP